jgi:hypothetical protein
MDALITNHYHTKQGQHFTIHVEGQETLVAVYGDGRVDVCVMNAAARRYRGLGGRVFNTADEAIGGYKSEKTRTAIALAVTCAPDFANLQTA